MGVVRNTRLIVVGVVPAINCAFMNELCLHKVQSYQRYSKHSDLSMRSLHVLLHDG